ncbi:MAG: hypothetical protein M3Z66_24485 [Chloroflexota bacterium]|nr:hypothetical protein [Chloroflexota bacterium]
MTSQVPSLRRKYHVAVSLAYLALGGVIVARSIAGHVLPVGILGLVFIALALVRLRDYRTWKNSPR